MLLSHRARLLELWRIAATYRIDTHLSIEDAPQLQPLARLIRLLLCGSGGFSADLACHFAEVVQHLRY